MNRIPAYIATAAILALTAGCPGKKDDTPTPVPSTVCDSNSNGLVWCKQPAPTATPEGLDQ